MQITLNQLKQWNACKTGYYEIKNALGDGFGDDIPIPIETGLSVSVQDTVWALSHDPDAHRFQSLMIDIVTPMADINPAKEVVNCIQALRDFRDGKITRDELRRLARAAARLADAAAYAVDVAAYAARYVARVACDRVARAALASARVAHAAADAAGDDEYIKNLIRKYY